MRNLPDGNHYRQDKLTRQWVIYAPGRGERPSDFAGEAAAEQHARPAHDPDCPFCPGNEDHLPDIIAELPGADARWAVRAVPNKYPMLKPEATTGRLSYGLHLAMPGYGQHEVIIEHPRHDEDLATLPPAAVARVIEMYHRRYQDLMRAHESMLCLIFRNHGAGAGTSLRHPHSQLVMTGVAPRYVRWREEQALRYYDEWGRSIFSDLMAFELREERRVILQNDHFVAFVPFAAEAPYEVWIMPRRARADFGSISDQEKDALAAALRTVLRRLRAHLGDPDYNFIVNTAPRYQAGEPHLCWYVHIRPRVTIPAGFEVGSGISVNPSLPEEDAALLKIDPD